MDAPRSYTDSEPEARILTKNRFFDRIGRPAWGFDSLGPRDVESSSTIFLKSSNTGAKSSAAVMSSDVATGGISTSSDLVAGYWGTTVRKQQPPITETDDEVPFNTQNRQTRLSTQEEAKQNDHKFGRHKNGPITHRGQYIKREFVSHSSSYI